MLCLPWRKSEEVQCLLNMAEFSFTVHAFVFLLVRNVLVKPNVKGLEDEEEAPLPSLPL